MGVIKTFNGLARASMKTHNGLAIASVKTWNGMDAVEGGASYIIQEDFTGGTTDETWGLSPLIDSGSLLDGVYSGYETSNDPWIDLGQGYDELWVYMMRVQNFSNDCYWGIMKSSWTPGAFSQAITAFYMRRQWNRERYITYLDNVSFGGNITGMTTGVPNHVWVRCKKGSGSNAECDVYASTNGIRGSVRNSTTSGTLTEQMRYLSFNNDNVRYDKIRVSTSPIGDYGALL